MQDVLNILCHIIYRSYVRCNENQNLPYLTFGDVRTVGQIQQHLQQNRFAGMSLLRIQTLKNTNDIID